MNASRHAQLERGLTSLARKVYECLGDKELSVPQVTGVLYDRGQKIAKDLIQGCLRDLVRQGLVRESADHYFWRIPVKDKQALSVVDPPRPLPKPEPTMPPPSLLERIASAATSLRRVANELDEIALVVEERGAVESAELDKLRQLRAALQSSLS
jgi:hypothetical protein